MNGRRLNSKELEALVPGEGITLTAVIAIMAIALLAVITYRLFMSNKGTMKMPGGWAFSWN